MPRRRTTWATPTKRWQAIKQEPVENLRTAIQAYSEALRFRIPERSALDYAGTQNNLGIAYKALAGYQEPVENLRTAVQAYGEALRFYTPERSPLDYARTQNNLGNAYKALAGYQEPVENLGRAIQAYGEALRFRTPERSPLDYAATQDNLGIAYKALAGYQEPVENLGRANQAYSEAVQANPKDANNLGNYAGLMLSQGKLEEGYSALERAIKLLPDEHVPAVEAEICFYAYAHWPADKRADALKELKRVLIKGIRSPDWDLSANIERALQDGHPDTQWLEILANVITKGEDIGKLDDWPEWKAA
jgi:tetratricopeptide (TPR) repeat protein